MTSQVIEILKPTFIFIAWGLALGVPLGIGYTWLKHGRKGRDG